MKTNIDDATLQAAIDEACQETTIQNGYQSLDLRTGYSGWSKESPARLALARAFLARLPEPALRPLESWTLEERNIILQLATRQDLSPANVLKQALRHYQMAVQSQPPPPVVDGKTPGEVDYMSFHGPSANWEGCICKDNYERCASAVLAAFGRANLEDAIARMEAVPVDELLSIIAEARGDGLFSLDLLRSHLIAAAKGPINLEAAVGATPGSFAKTCDDPKTSELPAPEIPWKEWHGGECPLKDEEVEEWEYKTRNGMHIAYPCDCPSAYIWQIPGDDIAAYRVLKWRDGCGPDAVDWKAKYEEAQAKLDYVHNMGLRFGMMTSSDKPEPYLAHTWIEDSDHERMFREWSESIGLKAQLQKAEAELAEVKAKLLDTTAGAAVTAERAGRVGAELAEIKDYLWPNQTGLPNEHRNALIAIKRREELIAKAALSRLRPISEAGPVPEGAVRWYCYFLMGLRYMGNKLTSQDTHYADILLPEASQPTVEDEQADPYAELKAAHAAGKVIENLIAGKWGSALSPTWEYPVDTYRIKPDPSTFEAHGKTWTRHTPGDPMPCDGDAILKLLFADNRESNLSYEAKELRWTKQDSIGDIIGWRYADESTPEPAQPWTPAVGDKVQLKGGSFTMTVEQADSDGIACEWHDSNGVPQARTYTPETLQPA